MEDGDLFAERLDRLTKRRIGQLGLGPTVRCLEIGGGRGSIARWLCRDIAPRGHVTATDLETDFLSREALPNLTVLCHDVRTDDFPEGSFDLVHVRAVLMHIPDRMGTLQRMAVARNCHRVGGMVADWVTISSLATAGGTLVLAIATFASVRSANRAARVAEQTLLDGLRPQLMASRFNDPPEKVSFVDQHWIRVNGGCGVIEIADDVIYMAIALRNVGRGMAILDGWAVRPNGTSATYPDHHPLTDFRRLTRDLYIPFEGLGFWQGAVRDPAEPLFAEIRDSVERREPVSVELLYRDTNGGQRAITRFGLMPHDDQEGNRIWLAAVSRHWNLDRVQPR